MRPPPPPALPLPAPNPLLDPNPEDPGGRLLVLFTLPVGRMLAKAFAPVDGEEDEDVVVVVVVVLPLSMLLCASAEVEFTDAKYSLQPLSI